MDPITLEDSEPNKIRRIKHMQSVVATVSGYHGTERFKLIKLIAHTGASYVGAMSRSITHLVCWKLEGKKYEVARQLGTHVVSHRWFEDCLKEGKRLPENAYAMQCGQDVGPISWDMPVILDACGTKKKSVTKERNMLSDLSNASTSSRVADVNASCSNVQYNWYDSHLLNETLSLKPLEESSSYSPMCAPRNKRNFCDASGSGLIAEPARRSRRLLKNSSLYKPLNCVMLDSSLTESYDALKVNNSVNSDRLSTVSKESKRQALTELEDIGDPNNSHVSTKSNSSKRCALSPPTTLIQYCEHIDSDNDFSDAEENHKGQNKESDLLDEYAELHTKIEPSCVICWTDFCSTRGVLACGHRFCYSCIQGWADCMMSRGKVATCPLCKGSFSHITKIDETASHEQKIYSQTVPCGSTKTDIFVLPDWRDNHDTWPSRSDCVCYQCRNREPEDLLVCCRICQNHWVHSCCLDPPLIPWTCVSCTDLRALYQRFH